MTKLEPLREVYTPEQAAQLLQLNRETIYRYIKEGKLEAARLGRALRIPRRSLELLLLTSNTRPYIKLREYTADQLADFVKEDALEGEALKVAGRFDKAQSLGFSEEDELDSSAKH